jgi:uncharacterized membrane protein
MRRRLRLASALTRLLVAGAIGVAAGGVAAVWTSWQVAALAGWDTVAVVISGWIWVTVRRLDAAGTERIAMREDDSRPAADILLVVASVASLVGVGFALLKASHQTGAAEAVSTAVAILSVALSWLAVHIVFTLRYAHLYYAENGGIDFHQDARPDYRDFLYVALTLGMTYQVSDTDISSKEIRMAVLRHAMLSYVFGTAVVAMTINIVASLLGR